MNFKLDSGIKILAKCSTKKNVFNWKGTLQERKIIGVTFQEFEILKWIMESLECKQMIKCGDIKCAKCPNFHNDVPQGTVLKPPL